MKIFTLFGLLGNNLKLGSILIVSLLFFGSILEMLGISLILPLLSILINTDNQSKYIEYLNLIFGYKNLINQTPFFFSAF